MYHEIKKKCFSYPKKEVSQEPARVRTMYEIMNSKEYKEYAEKEYIKTQFQRGVSKVYIAKAFAKS